MILLDPNLCASPISDSFRVAVRDCTVPYAHWYHLPVGIFAVAAGASAAAMAIKEQAGWTWKGSWLLLVFLFTAVELRMIVWSDADAKREREFSECKVENNFQTIERENQDTFRETMCEVGKVFSNTEQNVDLTKKTLQNLTGGGSYGYVIPTTLRFGHVKLLLQGKGDNILLGVKVRITENKAQESDADDEHDFPIGSLQPSGSLVLPVELHPHLDSQTGLTQYHVEVSAQNGTVEETIDFRRSNADPWLVYAYRLTLTKYTPIATKSGFIPDQKGRVLIKTDWTDAYWTKMHPAH